MAKFLNEKDIVNSHVKDYMDRVTDLSKYINGSPSFVTYYNKDMLASTNDMGLKGVHEIVGMESPIRYNKINDFPIYNITEFQIDIDTDEDDGTNTSIDGEGIILADCGITPMIDDCFYISYDSRKLIFRINDVQISSINDRVLYRISYAYTKWNLDILEENQISKEYDTVFDNIGNKNIEGKVLLEKSISIKISKLTEFKEELKKVYIEYFYNKDLNTFLYDNDEYLIYDNLLMNFIKNNNLFIRKKTFVKNIYIEPLLHMNYKDIKEYKKSIYYNIEKDIYENYDKNPIYFTFDDIVGNENSIFQVFKHSYPNVKRLNFHSMKIENIIDQELEYDYIVRRYFLFLKKELNPEEEYYDSFTREQEVNDLYKDILDYKYIDDNFEYEGDLTFLLETYVSIPIIMTIIDKLIKIMQELN